MAYSTMAPLAGVLVAQPALAAETGDALSLTAEPLAWLALALFVLAYTAVIAEERLRLAKSKPVLLAAGLIWVLVGVLGVRHGATEAVNAAFRHTLLEFSELFLFLLSAMTYINTMDDRGVFAALRTWLVGRGLTLKGLFWATGALAFLLSPVLDNLTTALVLGAVIMATGRGHATFLTLASINVVVAANAGGAFSPFGDITTLMVWQKGVVAFPQFFRLFLPALVNWLVPALLMARAIPSQPAGVEDGREEPRTGALAVVVLFALTIGASVLGHIWLHLPPVAGMLLGLALLKIYAYLLERAELRGDGLQPNEPDELFAAPAVDGRAEARSFDSYRQLERAEWDTLMFFHGVIMAVGGLGFLGYLAGLSAWLYGAWGETTANILLGPVSAVIDNIPVMYAVLGMAPQMSLGQWLLVTLTAGVGGSLLSIGSAAGVALMGQAKGTYTFMGHLRWTWAIALGYAASVAVHLLLNHGLF
ncbi:MAG: sodium:proton antiporter NhaD [Candidatus Sericytochromatia bacterium]|nr:sodium:proton antiporter NhaD [Candidatus Sericytochromatia bacterium]